MKLAPILLFVSVLATAAVPPSLSEDEMEELNELLLDMHSAYSQFQGFVRQRNLTDSAALAGLRFIIEESETNTNEISVVRRQRAIWCLRALNSPEAFTYAEELVGTETKRWPPTIVFREMAFRDEARLPHLSRIMDTSSEPLFKFWIYESIRDELQTTVPQKEMQTRLVRFLLDRSLVEKKDFAQLDELLCREVPKWRASPHRAENAAKMIREHPNDTRLVSFFETVRTNALESARTTLLSEGENANLPATTNQTSRTSAPSAGSDPWADLLDNLPEKKPWTPPPGYEPPF